MPALTNRTALCLLFAACAPDGPGSGNQVVRESSAAPAGQFLATDAAFQLGWAYRDPQTGRSLRISETDFDLFRDHRGHFTGIERVVLIPEPEGREPIDPANAPSRLHPALTGDALLLAQDVVEGAADWDVFSSSWWPQSRNGIAQRWQIGELDRQENYSDHSDRDRLSPVEKYDLIFNPIRAAADTQLPEVRNCPYHAFIAGGRSCPAEALQVRPAHTVVGPATRWELLNHGNWQTVAPDSWWGYCNGWASYATAEPLGAPRHDIRVRRADDGTVVRCGLDQTDCMLFRMADIEALMSSLYFSDSATFSGRRCNLNPDEISWDEVGRPVQVECRDINPATVHIALVQLLGIGARPINSHSDDQAQKQRLAFIVDYQLGAEVWNFPVTRFRIEHQEFVDEYQATQAVCAGSGDELCRDYRWNPLANAFLQVRTRYWMVSDGVWGEQLYVPAHERAVADHEAELHYILELERRGDAYYVLGGEWIRNSDMAWGIDSRQLHPDFLWMAVHHEAGLHNSDDVADADNPFIRYSEVQQLLRWAIE
jgi:hypothetical protein